MTELLRDERILVTQDGGIAHVRLSRPDKMNALDPVMFDAIIAAGDLLRSAPGVRCVVLSGEGRAFCAGLDTASFASVGQGTTLITQRTHGNANRFQEVAMTWRKCPVPVVAALHGVCFGGGMQIASGADIRIAAPDTRLAIMEMKWGLVPDMGGFALWRGLVRRDVLRELVFTNREVRGEEAQALGLVTQLAADPLAAAQALAREIASRNPDAVRAAKRLADAMFEQGEDALLLAESEEQGRIMRQPNQVEAVMAGMAGRAPVFTDPSA